MGGSSAGAYTAMTMATRTPEQTLGTLERMVADLFIVDASYVGEREIQLVLRWRFDRKRSSAMLRDRLKTSGFTFEMQEDETSLNLRVNPDRRLYIPRLNIILFLLTIASCYFVPLFIRYGGIAESFSEGLALTREAMAQGEGIEFTLAIMSILLVHEMGHWLASRRRDIITSWPYFIPAPNIIGTFGAVIKSKSPFWNRRDLIEVGAAGPIAGWVVALGWLVYGLAGTQIVPTPSPGTFSPDLLWTLRGESLLIKGLAPLLAGPLGEGYVYKFTEAAFAGWVGLLVTAINMLPIGQLDGGHIIYGLWGDLQKKLGWIAVAFLLVLGLQSMMWWFFAALGLIFGVHHPPTINDDEPVSRPAAVMGLIALVILLLSFAPVPFAFPFPGW